MKKIFAAILAAVMLTSCGSTPTALVKVVYPKPPSENSSYEERSEWMDNTAVSEEFESALKGFSIKTGEQVLSESVGNANYSPLSLYFALALAAQGAEGKARDELVDLLEVKGAEDSDELALLADQCSRFYRRIYSDGSYSKLTVSNSVWSNVGLRPEFAKTAAESFYAECFDTLDAKAVGEWIKKQTRSTLKPTIEVGPEEVLKIINAVYFADEWTDRFDSSKTEPDIFHAPTGDVESEFMNQKTMSGFSRGEGFTRASLGLKNGGMSFILPDEGADIRELIAKLGLDELLNGGESFYGDVTWSVPKFSFDSGFKLKDMLVKLGADEIFSRDADFSGIADSAPLFISDIIQNTHIAVDEKGVTASAYTEIGYSGSPMPTGSAEMILNRPFLYTISTRFGQLLFVGIVENPQSK